VPTMTSNSCIPSIPHSATRSHNSRRSFSGGEVQEDADDDDELKGHPDLDHCLQRGVLQFGCERHVRIVSGLLSGFLIS